MKFIKLKNPVSHQPRQGFTLIELVFATVILGTMLTITMVTFVGVFRFYNWARTTRDNQVAARQALETITREIDGSVVLSASDDNKLCLKNVSTGKGKRIGLNTSSFNFTFPIGTTANDTTIYSQEIKLNPTGTNCTSRLLVGTATTISNPTMKVSSLSFGLIKNSINTSYVVSNAAQFRDSTTINMTVTNGTVDSNGKCRVGDNFCDQAEYSTAVAGQ